MNLKLKQIEAKGLMKLPDGTYDMNGDFVIVSGRNAQGKSSLLNIVEWALGAKVGAGIGKLIRVGEEGAKIVATYQSTNDREYHMHVTVSEKEGDEKIKVTLLTDDGAKYDSIKAIKEFLRTPADIAVDVMEVARNQETASGRAKNLALFNPLLGIDLAKEQGEVAQIKAVRTETSKEIKSIEGMFATHGIAPEDTLAVVQPVKVDDLETDLSILRHEQTLFEKASEFANTFEATKAQRQEQYNKTRADVESYKQREEGTIKGRIAILEAELKQLRDQLEAGITAPAHMTDLLVSIAEAQAKDDEKLERAAAIIEKGDKLEAIAAMVKQINEAGEANARIKLLENMHEQANKLFSLRADAIRTEELIKAKQDAINQAVSEAAAKARIPKKFQFVAEDGMLQLYYKDPENGAIVPFNRNQVAASQMALGSLALTIAYHNAEDSAPRFIVMKDASLLDPFSLKEAADMANAAGYTLYAEIVSAEDGVTVEVQK